MRRSFLTDICCHNPRQSSHADDSHAGAGAGAGAEASEGEPEEEAEEEDFFREVEEGMAGISEALGSAADVAGANVMDLVRRCRLTVSKPAVKAQPMLSSLETIIS